MNAARTNEQENMDNVKERRQNKRECDLLTLLLIFIIFIVIFLVFMNFSSIRKADKRMDKIERNLNKVAEQQDHNNEQISEILGTMPPSQKRLFLLKNYERIEFPENKLIKAELPIGWNRKRYIYKNDDINQNSKAWWNSSKINDLINKKEDNTFLQYKRDENYYEKDFCFGFTFPSLLQIDLIVFKFPRVN